MTELCITNAVMRLAANWLDIDVYKIRPNSRFIDDLGADSLEIPDVALQLEILLDEELSGDELSAIIAVEDISRVLAQKMISRGRYVSAEIDVSLASRGRMATASGIKRQANTISQSELFKTYFDQFNLKSSLFERLLSEQVGQRWIEQVTTVPEYDDDGKILHAHVIILTRTHLFYYRLQESSVFTAFDKIENILIFATYEYGVDGEVTTITTKARHVVLKDEVFGSPLEFSFSMHHGIRGATEFLRKYHKYRESNGPPPAT